MEIKGFELPGEALRCFFFFLREGGGHLLPVSPAPAAKAKAGIGGPRAGRSLLCLGFAAVVT
ncbi:MAG: hypothetical protein ACFWTZ_02090 [Burkholderia sp.]|jgi:hypothetical protein